MDRAAFAARIDHTVLGPATTLGDVETVLDEAAHHGMNACIPPCYVSEAAEYAPETTIVTVCGFPHGQHAPTSKEAEAERAWMDGADEIDVVVNVGRLCSGDTGAVESELQRIVAAVPVPIKVIVEAPLLSAETLDTVCELAVAADASFLRTATGVSDSGDVTAEDVERMAEYLPVETSGGIGSFEDALAMLDAGAERIGSSAGVDILDGFDPEAFE